MPVDPLAQIMGLGSLIERGKFPGDKPDALDNLHHMANQFEAEGHAGGMLEWAADEARKAGAESPTRNIAALYSKWSREAWQNPNYDLLPERLYKKVFTAAHKEGLANRHLYKLARRYAEFQLTNPGKGPGLTEDELSMTEQDRQIFNGYVRQIAKELKPDRSRLGKFDTMRVRAREGLFRNLKAVDRYLGERSGWRMHEEFLRKAEAKRHPPPVGPPRWESGRPGVEEEARAYTERGAAQAFEAGDPIKSEAEGLVGFLESGALLATRAAIPMAGSMAVSAIPGVGQAGALAWWMAQIGPETIYRLQEEKGYSAKTARMIGFAFSLPNAAIEMVQVAQLLPKMSQGVRKAVGRRMSKALIGFVLERAAAFTGEVTEEGLQRGCDEVAVLAAHYMERNVDFEGMRHVPKAMWDETVEAMKVMPWLMFPGFVGGGIQARADVQAAQQQARDAAKTAEATWDKYLAQCRLEKKPPIKFNRAKLEQLVETKPDAVRRFIDNPTRRNLEAVIRGNKRLNTVQNRGWLAGALEDELTKMAGEVTEADTGPMAAARTVAQTKTPQGMAVEQVVAPQEGEQAAPDLPSIPQRTNRQRTDDLKRQGLSHDEAHDQARRESDDARRQLLEFVSEGDVITMSNGDTYLVEREGGRLVANRFVGYKQGIPQFPRAPASRASFGLEMDTSIPFGPNMSQEGAQILSIRPRGEVVQKPAPAEYPAEARKAPVERVEAAPAHEKAAPLPEPAPEPAAVEKAVVAKPTHPTIAITPTRRAELDAAFKVSVKAGEDKMLELYHAARDALKKTGKSAKERGKMLGSYSKKMKQPYLRAIHQASAKEEMARWGEEAKQEAKKPAEIRRIAREVRQELKRRGLGMTTVSHSPISRSVYYKTHLVGERYPTEIRISDHELPHGARAFDLVLTHDAAENDKRLAAWLEDYGFNEIETEPVKKAVPSAKKAVEKPIRTTPKPVTAVPRPEPPAKPTVKKALTVAERAQNEAINKLQTLDEVRISKTPAGKWKLQAREIAGDFVDIGEFDTVADARARVMPAHKKMLTDFRARKQTGKAKKAAPKAVKGLQIIPYVDKSGAQLRWTDKAGNVQGTLDYTGKEITSVKVEKGKQSAAVQNALIREAKKRGATEFAVPKEAPKLKHKAWTPFEEKREGLPSLRQAPTKAPVQRRLITDEMRENARKTMRETKLFGGIPVDKMKAMTVLAAGHLEDIIISGVEKTKRHAAWVKEMVKQYTPEIKPHLKKLWASANARLREVEIEVEVKTKLPLNVQQLIERTTPPKLAAEVIKMGKAAPVTVRNAAANLRELLRRDAALKRKVQAFGDWEAAEKAAKTKDPVVEYMGKMKIGYREGLDFAGEISDELEGESRKAHRFFHKLNIKKRETNDGIKYIAIDEVANSLGLSEEEVLSRLLAAGRGEKTFSGSFYDKLYYMVEKERETEGQYEVPEDAESYEKLMAQYEQIGRDINEAADVIRNHLLGGVSRRWVKPVAKRKGKPPVKPVPPQTIAKAYRAGQADVLMLHKELARSFDTMGVPAFEQGNLVKDLAKAKTAKDVLKIVKRAKAIAATVGMGRQVITGRDLFRYALRHEAKGARRAWYVGQLEAQATRKELIDYAKENLPEGERGLLNRALTHIAKSRTPASWGRVIEAVNLMVEHYNQALAYKEFRAERKECDRAANPDSQAKSKFDSTYRQMWLDLREGFALSKPSDRAKARLNSLLEASVKDDLGEIPEAKVKRALERLADAGRKPLNEMSSEAIRAVTDAMKTLRKFNELKNELRAAQKIRNTEHIVDQFTDAVVDTREQTYEVDPRAGRVSREATNLRLEMTTQETRLLQMMGENELGMNIVRWMPLEGDRTECGKYTSGHAKRLEMERDARTALRAIQERLGITDEEAESWSAKYVKKPKMITFRFAGDQARGIPAGKLEMTINEAMGVIALCRDPNRRAQLFHNQMKGITLDEDKDAVRITPERLAQMEKETNAATRGKATVYIDALVEYVNGESQTEYRQAWERIHFFDPLPADAGIHWPSVRARRFKGGNLNQVAEWYAERHAERLPSFRQRVPGSTDPFLIVDIDTAFLRNCDHVAALVGIGQIQQDLMTLFKSKRGKKFQDAILHGFKNGRQWIDAMLTDYEAWENLGVEPANASVTDISIKKAIRLMHRGALTGRPYIVAYQAVSYLNASHYIEWKYLTKAKNASLENRRRIRKTLEEHPILNNRFNNKMMGHELMTAFTGSRSARQDKGLPDHKLAAAIDKMGLDQIHFADTQTIISIGCAAEEQGKALGYTGKELSEYTRHKTLETALGSQPPLAPLSSTLIATKGAVNKGWTQYFWTLFGTQPHQNVNLAYRRLLRYIREPHKTPASTAAAARDIAVPIIINGLGIKLIRGGYMAAAGTVLAGVLCFLGGTPPPTITTDKQRERDKKRKAIRWWTDYFRRIFGSVPIVGRFAEGAAVAAKRFIMPGDPTYARPPGGIMAGAIDDTVKSVGQAFAALGYAFGMNDDGELVTRGPNKGRRRSVVALERAVLHFMRGPGLFFGPTSSIASHYALGKRRLQEKANIEAAKPVQYAPDY